MSTAWRCNLCVFDLLSACRGSTRLQTCLLIYAWLQWLNISRQWATASFTLVCWLRQMASVLLTETAMEGGCLTEHLPVWHYQMHSLQEARDVSGKLALPKVAGTAHLGGKLSIFWW